MSPYEDYATEPSGKASFKINLDGDAWEIMQKTAPSIDIAFDLFPDLEAIEIDFIKPDPHADCALLSGVPRAWIRLNGEVEAYIPTDDLYGLAGYLLEAGEQISPLPYTYLPTDKLKSLQEQQFSILFTPSACLVRTPPHLEETLALEKNIVIEGFTSQSNPGGSKQQRLNAQMASVCEVLGKQVDARISLEAVQGSL